MTDGSKLEAIAGFIEGRAADVRLAVDDFFVGLARRALDEVIDGPRTGRWNVGQLSKTEKTYIGTKIEILTRAALGVPCGIRTDCLIADIETDVKWSMNGASWMIGPENVGQVCLGICTDRSQAELSVGLFVAHAASLTTKGNRDQKRSLLASAKRHIHWVVQKTPLPQNFLANLTDDIRRHIFAGESVQERVRRLAEASPMSFVPRQAFETVAMRPAGDPFRRTRQDRYNAKGLGSMQILNTRKRGAEVRKILDLPRDAQLPKDHFLVVPNELYFRFYSRAGSG